MAEEMAAEALSQHDMGAASGRLQLWPDLGADVNVDIFRFGRYLGSALRYWLELE